MMRWPLTIILLLFLIPDWMGEPKLPLPSPDMEVGAAAVVPKGGWPARIGALEPVGAVALAGSDPAFGGFSALSLVHGQAVLLSDGGYTLSLAIRGGRLIRGRVAILRDGPRDGWSRLDRDTESLAHDPATGRWWVGYENANAIWRYPPDFAHAEGHVAPAAMAGWRANGGAETLVRLRDGRFVVLAEVIPRDATIRPGLIFPGDPTARARASVATFSYRPPAGFSPTDAAQLPNGDLLVLHRRFHLPLRFAAVVTRVPLSALRRGATVSGREIARFPDSLIGENMEGIAITREGADTMVWIVTDNDMAWWRRTILAKYRLR